MKKGFTLIEILAVITLLGIIVTLLLPNITASIKSSRQRALDVQITEIKQSAEEYVSENLNLSKTTPTYVSIETLKTNGYLDSNNIKNPLTNETMNGCVKFTYNDTYKNFDKDYVETCE